MSGPFLTDAEQLALRETVTRTGGDADMADRVLTWAAETRASADLLTLLLNGSVHVFADVDGQLKFALSSSAASAAQQRLRDGGVA